MTESDKKPESSLRSDSKYVVLFQQALKAYINKGNRSGYKRGWFSFLRHRSVHKTIKETQEAILKSPQDAESLIKSLLIMRKKAAHNHSFVMYLLDELKQACPTLNWQEYDPKPIILRNGLLYRGTPIAPEIIFKHGFIDRNPSNKIDDYVADMNGSVGISTTTDYGIAQSYALPRVQIHGGEILNNFEIQPMAYVYKINYRGLSGVDLVKTAQARGNKISAALSKTKEEVNIVGKIDPADIEGVWKVYRDGRPKEWILNKSYQATREPDVNKEPIIRLLANKVIEYLKHCFTAALKQEHGKVL